MALKPCLEQGLSFGRYSSLKKSVKVSDKQGSEMEKNFP